MSITLAQICDAIESTLSPAVTYTQSYNDLTEGMNDLPRLQVYPFSGTSSPPQNTDRTTFSAVVRQHECTIYADLYATVRSEIGEDMAILLPLIDLVIDEIEKQDRQALFGLDGLRGFRWGWQYVNFDYAGKLYTGARFTFTFRVF